MPDGLVGDPALRQRLADIGLGDAADVGRRQTLVDMLMRENDLRRFDGLAVFITHRHLALGVGAEALLLAGVARLGEQFENLVRIIERGRHEFGRLAHRIAEHDALIARAFVLVASGVDALCDIDGLLMQQHFDVGGVPVEAVLLVTDVLDGVAGDLDDAVERNMRTTHFAGDDDAIGGAERLCGDTDRIGIDAGLGAFAEELIDDFIGDAVADLVRMSFGNGLTGEKIIFAGQSTLS